MRKLTDPWIWQTDPARRAEYAADARARLAELTSRPVAAVFIRSTESYRLYRVLATTDKGRHTAIVSDIAGAAYESAVDRVVLLGGDVVEGSGQGWLLRVNRDGVEGREHVKTVLSFALGRPPAEFDVTEF